MLGLGFVLVLCWLAVRELLLLGVGLGVELGAGLGFVVGVLLVLRISLAWL